MVSVVVVFVTVWGVVALEPVDYSHARMVRVNNITAKDMEELALMEDFGDIEIIAAATDSIDILMLNDSVLVNKELINMNMSYKILVDNVQEVIDKEQEMEMVANNTAACEKGSCITWDKYYRLNIIFEYLDYLQRTYPDQLTVETIGYSAEQRPLKVAKITGNKSNVSEKAVWVDGGIHAREWVTPAAALYLIHQVIDSLNTEGSNSTFYGLSYYILAVVNPDGYEYSHTKDRFWRKNRSANKGSSCKGTDLNRNWNHKWAGPESWADPCHMNYRGPRAFSEPETVAVSNYLLNKTGEIRAYLSLHSYGQNVLFPWAFSYTRPSDYKDLYELAYYMAYKIKLDNQAIYKYGGAAETYYIASGGSQDWAKGTAKIKYSFTLELRDTGKFMFSLPPSEILKASKDAFAAFTVLSQKVKTDLANNVN